ncbi:MAG: hypothetical protein Kapaf2KO_03420 [Candidatus Kapaibacteriales bacterium]
MEDLKPLKPFFIEIRLPETKSERFMELVPKHRMAVQKWIKQGVIRSYNLSYDRTMLWVVMYGSSYSSIADAVASLPLAEYFESKITELLFTENNSSYLPELSVN